MNEFRKEKDDITKSLPSTFKMASTGNQWETVGKSKKTKSQSPKGARDKKKTNPNNMPTITPAAPVKESATIYDAFIEKERKAEAKLAAETHKTANGGDSTKKSTQPKPKKPSQADAKKTVLTLEQAVEKIDVKELEIVLEKDQTTFPDNPSVWLLDLASLLNLKLENIPEKDPLYEDKSPDYPACLLTKKVRGVLLNTVQHCSTSTLTAFADHCMQSMTSDMSKGISTYGYRIFLQLLAIHKPDVLLAGLPKYLDMVQSNKNRPLRCLAIMWAVGQVGQKDLSNGLKVWLELMLPVLNCRSLSAYGVTYLENLFKMHKNKKNAFGAISFKNFFPILDHIFNQQSPLPSNLQKKLMSLYPEMKSISFGAEKSSNLRNFFPSFLARLTPHCPPAMKEEVLSSLVTCLGQDKHCFSVWRQMYLKHLLQSSELLQHIVTSWSSVSSQLDRKLLKETIRAFSITNDELAAQNKTSYDGYKKCVQCCQDLLVKMARGGFPWRWLFFFIFSVCAGIVAYDVINSKGFKASKTNKFLVDSGILLFLESVWQRIKFYGGTAFVWLETNVPIYYAKTCEIVGPYLTLFWQKLYALGVYIAEVTKPQRDWLYQKVPVVLEWLQEKWPIVWGVCRHYLGVVWSLLLHYGSIAWDFLVHYSLIAGTWLQENVFKGSLSIENLQATAVSVLTALQAYMTAFIEWLAQLISSSMSDPDDSAAAAAAAGKAGA